ncbi:MAG: hypothetical protein HZB84_00810 [Deltaproteobacteria bacterium]|nr:hypothetical protein [Deltaproteobacteria bacterium]
MSLLAGFDLVAEISNETIRKLLKKNLQIGGKPVNPPFELSLPISGGGASGTAHLIVTDLQLDLNADDTITLTLSFDRTSVVTTAPLPLTVCPLDGNITITAALQLVNAGGSNQQVSVNIGAATVAINWSATANQEITNDLSGTPIITPATFNAFVTQMLTSFVHSVAAPTIPLAFSVVPGANGSLAPSLQFEKLEVHCIPNANRSKQALGIFGILLVVNHSHGNHSQKTSTAITAAHDGVCISIAPGAFHSLVFCPAIANALGTDVAHLPGSCGSGGSFDTQGVTINSISDSFANGHIDINGSAAKSGTCYDASGTFHGTLTFSISGSTLTPNINMDEPDIDVSIPWYCWLAAALVLGPLGIALAAVVDTVGDKIASSLAGDAIKKALGSGIPGVSVGGLSGASFSSVAITTEGITMQGTVPVFVYHPFVKPALHLSGSVITTQSQEIGSGIFHTTVYCMKEAKDYPYTEYSQQQTGSYNLSGTLVSQLLTPHYTINAGGPAVPLTGNSGTIELPNMDTHYPMPLAQGGTAMQQTVHIGYSISGTSIQLTNVPSEGNYGFYLKVTATDCNGNPVQDDTHHNLSTSVTVQFEGDHVEIGGDYAKDVQHCLMVALKEMMKTVPYPYPRIPQWPPLNYPLPESLIEYIRDLVASGLPQADEILVASKIAHGNSFYRAIFSPAASQPGLLKEKVPIAANQQQIANIALELINVSQRLLSTGSITQSAEMVGGLADREIKG